MESVEAPNAARLRCHARGTTGFHGRLALIAVAVVVGAATSPLFATESWTLWRGTTTYTDINARLPAEVQIEVQTGLDRAGCETMKHNTLAELRQTSPPIPGSLWDASFIRLERGNEGTTKVLMRYLCVRADARPGPAPWYSPGRTDPFSANDDRTTDSPSPK